MALVLRLSRPVPASFGSKYGVLRYRRLAAGIDLYMKMLAKEAGGVSPVMIVEDGA